MNKYMIKDPCPFSRNRCKNMKLVSKIERDLFEFNTSNPYYVVVSCENENICQMWNKEEQTV